jgi:hypothetical protein
MSTYHYAAYFQTPLHQSPAALSSHHPFGISSNASNLPMSSAKDQRQDSVLETTSSRISKAGGAILEQQQSIFFRLPAELRNQIYEELLCPNAPSTKDLVHRGSHKPKTRFQGLAQHDYHMPKPPALYPDILLTCRKAHEEAADMLYTTHIFHAHPSLLSSLPHLISSAKPVLYPAMIAKIKRWQLTLRLDTDPRFSAEQATAAFSGAEYLEIRVWQSMFDGADCSVLKLFLGVRGVKVAKVAGSVETGLARWLEARLVRDGDGGEEDLCRCDEASRSMVCAGCGKSVGNDGEWFGGRNAWQFGNR